jgi:hypothetical protein
MHAMEQAAEERVWIGRWCVLFVSARCGPAPQTTKSKHASERKGLCRCAWVLSFPPRASLCCFLAICPFPEQVPGAPLLRRAQLVESCHTGLCSLTHAQNPEGKVLLNLVNFVIRRKILYEPYGPWPHFPADEELAEQAPDVAQPQASEPEEEVEVEVGEHGIDADGVPVDFFDEDALDPLMPPLPQSRVPYVNSRLTRNQRASFTSQLGVSQEVFESIRNNA